MFTTNYLLSDSSDELSFVDSFDSEDKLFLETGIVPLRHNAFSSLQEYLYPFSDDFNCKIQLENCQTPYEEVFKGENNQWQTDNSDTIPESQASFGTLSQTSKKIKKTEVRRVSSDIEGKRIASGTNQNIIKNFSKAILGFCASQSGKAHLEPLLLKFGCSAEEFSDFIHTNKDCVESMRQLLYLTNPSQATRENDAACRAVLKEMSLVFLDYFCVNWIYNSPKLIHKDILMQNRFIIKKKIMNPRRKLQIIRPKPKSGNNNQIQLE